MFSLFYKILLCCMEDCIQQFYIYHKVKVLLSLFYTVKMPKSLLTSPISVR